MRAAADVLLRPLSFPEFAMVVFDNDRDLLRLAGAFEEIRDLTGVGRS